VKAACNQLIAGGFLLQWKESSRGQPILNSNPNALMALVFFRLRIASCSQRRRHYVFLIQQFGVDVIVGTVHNIFRQPDGIAEACRRFSRELG